MKGIIKIDENDLKNLKDVRFVITKDMKELVIDMLYTKQILDECDLTMKDKKLLQKHFDKQLNRFRKELQAHNPVEIQIIRSYLGSKKQDSE